MSNQNGLSMLDANQVIQEVHNQEEKALDVVNANSLVPQRFGKVELEYIASGNGMCEVGAARYFSNGAYHSENVTIHGDELGSAHKTIINFFNSTPQNLSNKYFTIFDNAEVTVWFNLDGTGLAPPTPFRKIEVIINSSDTEDIIVQKLNNIVNLDSSFFSVISGLMLMIVNSTVGVRKDSFDVNSGLVFKNIQGAEQNRLDGKYFILHSALDAEKYHVWYNINNSSIDPTPLGQLSIKIDISSGDSANEVCLQTAIKIAQTTRFITNNNRDILNITNKLIGYTTPIQDINCNFTSSILTAGRDRELVAYLVMTYDSNNDLVAVERM